MPTHYIDAALRNAHCELIENGRYFGRIESCEGVWAEAGNLEECREELRGALESWILGGVRHGDVLPVIGGIDLNAREMVDAEAYKAPRLDPATSSVWPARTRGWGIAPVHAQGWPKADRAQSARERS